MHGSIGTIVAALTEAGIKVTKDDYFDRGFLTAIGESQSKSKQESRKQYWRERSEKDGADPKLVLDALNRALAPKVDDVTVEDGS